MNYTLRMDKINLILDLFSGARIDGAPTEFGGINHALVFNRKTRYTSPWLKDEFTKME